VSPVTGRMTGTRAATGKNVNLVTERTAGTKIGSTTPRPGSGWPASTGISPVWRATRETPGMNVTGGHVVRVMSPMMSIEVGRDRSAPTVTTRRDGRR